MDVDILMIFLQIEFIVCSFEIDVLATTYHKASNENTFTEHGISCINIAVVLYFKTMFNDIVFAI